MSSIRVLSRIGNLSSRSTPSSVLQPARFDLRRSCQCRHIVISPPILRSSHCYPGAPLGQALQPIRSAIDPTVFVVAAVLSAGIAYFATRTYRDPEPELHSKVAQAPSTLIADMSASTAPGRPGNLTPEQEVKLKEMWTQLFEIYGISPAAAGGARARANTAVSENADAKKKKRSRLSFFGRGKEEDEEADEDKHGQNQEFKAALAADDPAQLRAAFWNLVKHDNPDAIVLRYLRARKWDVQKAVVMLVSTLHWTLTSDPYKIIAEGEGHAQAQAKSNDGKERREGEEFLQIMTVGKSLIHGRDVDGRPVVYVRARLHRRGQESDATMERFTIYTIETTRLFLTPEVDTATVVFDLQDFTLANMDNAPVNFMIKCFEANYPESLGAVVVYKAPWVFQGIWKIIKGLLDPVVAGKIHFENSADGLEKFLGPKSRIMKELDGDEDYEYKYVPPNPDENALMRNEQERDSIRAERQTLEKEYEAQTTAWLSANPSTEENERRSQIAANLTQNYWRLDPYQRARTLYDRTGVLKIGEVSTKTA